MRSLVSNARSNHAATSNTFPVRTIKITGGGGGLMKLIVASLVLRAARFRRIGTFQPVTSRDPEEGKWQALPWENAEEMVITVV